MSLGLGEGGEQNAPLGRAVIGGLLLATRDDALLRARDVQHPPAQAARARRPRSWRTHDAAAGAGPPTRRRRPGRAHGHELGFDLPAARDDLEDAGRRRSCVGGRARARRRVRRRLPAAPPRSAPRSTRRRRPPASAALRVEVDHAEGRVERPRASRSPAACSRSRRRSSTRARAATCGKWLRRHRRQGDGRAAPRRDRDARSSIRSSIRRARSSRRRRPTLLQSKANRELSKANLAALQAAHARRASSRRPTSTSGRRRRRSTRRTSSVAQATIAAQQANIRRLDAAQGVRARDGAVRRDDHAALGRGRRAGHGGQRAAALQDRRDGPGARLRPGAAGRGARASAPTCPRRSPCASTRAQTFDGQGRARGGRARRRHADDEHRGPRPEPRRRAHRRDVRRGRAHACRPRIASSSCRRPR